LRPSAAGNLSCRFGVCFCFSRNMIFSGVSAGTGAVYYMPGSVIFPVLYIRFVLIRTQAE
jgi:hypothetical protein